MSGKTGATDATCSARLLEAKVVSRRNLCREHHLLTLALPQLDDAHPGQFLHLGPSLAGEPRPSRPFLRRAFSIAGLRSRGQECAVDVVYRVHGAGTRWLASLGAGDRLSVLGPLGRGFEIMRSRPMAWLVSGGAGLPPLLWLAERLHRSGRRAVAFYGARTRDLIPLGLGDPAAISREGTSAAPAAAEFNRCDTPLVLATDDGTVGFPGTVGEALAAYHGAWKGADAEVMVYCCGPEPMMAAVARWCLDRGIECFVCLERAMACGTGTCQSCVVRLRDETDADGWRYGLCCSEGPVFAARDVIWD